MIHSVRKRRSSVARMLKGCLLVMLIVLINDSRISASEEKSHHLHDHHHHEHVDEIPHYKYSREANEKHLNEKSHELHEHHQHHESEVKQVNRKSKEVWLGAIGSTVLISIVPYLVLIFIPINNPHEHQSLLKILLSFASGGLLGDAFLHLIPHALIAQQANDAHHHEHSHHGHSHHDHSHGHEHHDHSHGHEHHSHDMSVGLCVLSGILVFLMIEKFVRIVKGSHHHNHQTHIEDEHEHEDLDDDTDELVDKDDEGEVEKSGNQKKVRFDDNPEIIHYEKLPNDEIKVAGYLNLAADFAHNFTDGLAIGASYLAGNSIGVVTTLTILFHEVPHEIGDFAILIQSGCSKSKAMSLQLITAFGALSGTILSLAAEGLSSTTSSLILPFTAGGFIYIATVSVIPELLEGSNLKQSFFEICALVVGVLSMVLIAQYE